MERTKSARLIELLNAQRIEARRRAAEARGSEPWDESSARLDDLNAQIMHLGAMGSSSRDVVGNGLELDLDSLPVEDAPFRRNVVDAVRAAVTTDRERIAVRSDGRIAAEAEWAGRTRVILALAELDVRTRYPRASLAASADPDPGTLTLQATRDGRLA